MNKLEPVIAFIDERLKQLESGFYAETGMQTRARINELEMIRSLCQGLIKQDELLQDALYPDNWPKCPACGRSALDGHITCGSVQCNEREMRIKAMGGNAYTLE